MIDDKSICNLIVKFVLSLASLLKKSAQLFLRDNLFFFIFCLVGALGVELEATMVKNWKELDYKTLVKFLFHLESYNLQALRIS